MNRVHSTYRGYKIYEHRYREEDTIHVMYSLKSSDKSYELKEVKKWINDKVDHNSFVSNKEIEIKSTIVCNYFRVAVSEKIFSTFIKYITTKEMMFKVSEPSSVEDGIILVTLSTIYEETKAKENLERIFKTVRGK